MTIQRQTSQEYFKSIKIIYFALLAGQLIFLFITLYLNLELSFSQESSDILWDIFLIIALTLALNGFVTGQLIYKNRLKKIKKYTELKTKMGEYKGAFLIRLAMLEGATLFSIVIYLITANLMFIGIAGIVIIYFVYLNPTRDKISFDLELNSTEKLLIENPNEIISEFEIRNF